MYEIEVKRRDQGCKFVTYLTNKLKHKSLCSWFIQLSRAVCWEYHNLWVVLTMCSIRHYIIYEYYSLGGTEIFLASSIYNFETKRDFMWNDIKSWFILWFFGLISRFSIWKNVPETCINVKTVDNHITILCFLHKNVSRKQCETRAYHQMCLTAAESYERNSFKRFWTNCKNHTTGSNNFIFQFTTFKTFPFLESFPLI